MVDYTENLNRITAVGWPSGSIYVWNLAGNPPPGFSWQIFIAAFDPYPTTFDFIDATNYQGVMTGEISGATWDFSFTPTDVGAPSIALTGPNACDYTVANIYTEAGNPITGPAPWKGGNLRTFGGAYITGRQSLTLAPGPSCSLNMDAPTRPAFVVGEKITVS